MNFNFDLAPGQVKPINVGSADFFAVVFCPGSIEVKFPGQEFVLFGQGDEFEMPPNTPQEIAASGLTHKTFNRVEIRNPSILNTSTVVLYAGLGRYHQNRQSVIEPDTEFSSSPIMSLASHANLVFDGITSGGRIRRKSIQISNQDNALSLFLVDKNGNSGLEVKAGHSITLPISQYVEIYNPNGSAVSFMFSEIWWTL